MNYTKFQGKIIEWPLVQKITDMIHIPKEKKIVNI